MSKYISLDWLVEYYFDEDVDYYGKYVREALLSEKTPTIDIVDRCKVCQQYNIGFEDGRLDMLQKLSNALMPEGKNEQSD